MEIFFRVVKSGCRVEALQLTTVERLERALVIYLVIAWRILYLMTLGRDCPHLPCEVAFTAAEWRATWLTAICRGSSNRARGLWLHQHLWVMG